MEKFEGGYRKDLAEALNKVKKINPEQAREFLKKEKKTLQYQETEKIQEGNRQNIQKEHWRKMTEDYFDSVHHFDPRRTEDHKSYESKDDQILENYISKISGGISNLLKKYEGEFLPKIYVDAINEYRKTEEEIHELLRITTEKVEKISNSPLFIARELIGLLPSSHKISKSPNYKNENYTSEMSLEYAAEVEAEKKLNNNLKSI